MRALWSGAISFGLVNIPVKLYSASQERAMKFRMLDSKDHCPISYKKVCASDDHPVAQKDIVKGYEVEKGEYVILEPADFKRASAKKTEMIDIVAFATSSDIDPKYFDKPYWLEPSGKGAQKAYVLLRDALRESGKVGIAKYVLRDKEHLGVLKPDGDAILLDQMRYADELRDDSELSVPESVKYEKRELELAESLIDKLTDRFNIKDYRDTYTDELLKVIRAKAKGKLARIKEPRKAKAIPAKDILEALKKSLEEEGARSGDFDRESMKNPARRAREAARNRNR